MRDAVRHHFKSGVITMRQYTLSLHQEGQNNVRQNHNARRYMPPNADAEKSHLNRCYCDESIRDAYGRLFSAAVDDFNRRQQATGHYKRMIHSYYDETVANPRKQAAYELIVQIGGNADGGCPDRAAEALEQYYRGWQQANPHLVCVGAYLHIDEASPHLHLDYIPVAEATRGMKMQNSVTGALKAQGFVTKGARNTAQMQWEQSERDRFRGICESLGISVAAQGIGRKRHLAVDEYKQVQDNIRDAHIRLDAALDDIDRAENMAAVEQIKADQQKRRFDDLSRKSDAAQIDIVCMAQEQRDRRAELDGLQSDIASARDKIRDQQADLSALDAAVRDKTAEMQRIESYSDRLMKSCAAAKKQKERYAAQADSLAKTVKDRQQQALRLSDVIEQRQQRAHSLSDKCRSLDAAKNDLQQQYDQLVSAVSDYRSSDECQAAIDYDLHRIVSWQRPEFEQQICDVAAVYGWNCDEWPDCDIDDLSELIARTQREQDYEL